MKTIGEESNRAATPRADSHPDGALRAQRENRGHIPISAGLFKFHTLGAFLSLTWMPKMLYSCSSPVESTCAALWLTLPARNKWSWEKVTARKQLGGAASFIHILGEKGTGGLTRIWSLEKLSAALHLHPQNPIPAPGKHLCPKEWSSGHPHGLGLSLWLIPTGYLETEKGVFHSWAVAITNDSRSLPWSRIGYCRVIAARMLRRI